MAGQNPQLRPLTKGSFGTVIQHAEPSAYAAALSQSASTETDRVTMFRLVWRFITIVLAATTLVAAPLLAQNGEQKPAAEAGKGETGKDVAARTDEVVDAARIMTGPAARGECVWLGERAVGLMWKDDLDTAFRHLELYDRFGCPREHVQISFRCVVRQGNIDQKDQKATDAFNARVHSCWINPALPPVAATPPTAAVEKSGTK
jgi:hypothetical protein